MTAAFALSCVGKKDLICHIKRFPNCFSLASEVLKLSSYVRSVTFFLSKLRAICGEKNSPSPAMWGPFIGPQPNLFTDP